MAYNLLIQSEIKWRSSCDTRHRAFQRPSCYNKNIYFKLLNHSHFLWINPLDYYTLMI